LFAEETVVVLLLTGVLLVYGLTDEYALLLIDETDITISPFYNILQKAIFQA
jgi:hypothetical protein